MRNSYSAVARQRGPFEKIDLMRQPQAILMDHEPWFRDYAAKARLGYPPHIKEAVAVPDPARGIWHFYISCPEDKGMFYEIGCTTVDEPRSLSNSYVVYNFLFPRRVATNKRGIFKSTGLELFSFDTKIARWVNPFDAKTERLEILKIEGLSVTTDNHVASVLNMTNFLADKHVVVVPPVKVLAEKPIVIGHEHFEEQPFTFRFPDEAEEIA